MRSLLRRETLRLAEVTLEQTLETLVAFLRAEQFAVVTYDAAMSLVRDVDAHEELGRLKLSHAGRAMILRERVQEFALVGGSMPPEPGKPEAKLAAGGAPPWGAFASVLEKVRAARDEWHAIAALREGECWALRDYQIDLPDVEPHLRRELTRLLLGEQRRTRARLLRLVVRQAALSIVPAGIFPATVSTARGAVRRRQVAR